MSAIESAACLGAEPRAVRLRRRTQLVATQGALVLQLGRRVAKIEPYNADVARFVRILSEGGSLSSLRFAWANDGLEPAITQVWLKQLEETGFIEDLTVGHGLDADDVERFAKLLDYFSEFETRTTTRFEPLRRLRESRVAIVGVGGQGSWAAYCLACNGIGRFRLVDGDTVEPSNLNRSILYSDQDIGRPKVEAAREALVRFAPRTQVEIHHEHITSAEQLAEHLDDVDLLVLAGDQPVWLIRYWATRAAIATHVPLLVASGVRVGPFFVPGEDGACAMCEWAELLERIPRARDVVRAAHELPRRSTGALSPFAAIKGGLVGLEAFNFLSGHAQPMTLGAVWEMSPDLHARITPVSQHQRCPGCGIGDVLPPPPGTEDVEGAPSDDLLPNVRGSRRRNRRGEVS